MNIKEIAEKAKVSIATVSRTINSPDRVHPDTARRVKKVLEEFEYTPNLTARALVTGSTNLIGLVVPSLVHSFFAEISQSLSRVLRDSGYSLLICCSDENPDIERQILAQLLDRGVDALLVASVQQGKDIFPHSTKRHVPYVLVDRTLQDLPAHFVGVDDVEVGFLATEHLVQIGCRCIAHIGGTHVSTAAHRLEGYRRAIKHYLIDTGSEYVVIAKSVDQSGDSAGYFGARKLLDLNPRPDGIFCNNDAVAIGAMRAILENGLRIPDDIAIIGCGNLHVDASLRVPLSTVDQQSDQIGQRSALLVMDLITDNDHDEKRTILLTPKLVIRQSTQRPN